MDTDDEHVVDSMEAAQDQGNRVLVIYKQTSSPQDVLPGAQSGRCMWQIKLSASSLGVHWQLPGCRLGITHVHPLITITPIVTGCWVHAVCSGLLMISCEGWLEYSVLPRLLLQGVAPCPLFVTPCPFEKAEMTPCPFD